jgi:azurin
MKKLLAQFCFVLLLISCGNEPKKEKFSYERVKVEEKTETNSNLLVLNSNDQMLFDKSVLKAKAGEEVNLLLNHTGQIGKEFMGHNFVLLKNGVDVDDFAQAAMLAKESEYIPAGDDTIAYTSMIGGGESDQISFTVDEAGTYVFLCTFPGHYQIMRGEFIVE